MFLAFQAWVETRLYGICRLPAGRESEQSVFFLIHCAPFGVIRAISMGGPTYSLRASISILIKRRTPSLKPDFQKSGVSSVRSLIASLFPTNRVSITLLQYAIQYFEITSTPISPGLYGCA